MHDEENDERGVARSNDEVRAALLEALDLADRAGVSLSWVQANAWHGRCTQVHLQGRDGDSRMSRSDALRIVLRARGSDVTVSAINGAGGRDPWLTLRTEMSGGVALEVYTVPTDDELEAAVVEAVLQS